MDIERYDEFFNYQTGGGGVGKGVGRIFVGSPYQRGHGGIGSFLAGIFRKVLPLLSSGAKVVGQEALRAGINVVSDMAKNTPVNESLRNRIRESGVNLKRKAVNKLDAMMTMEGSGYKRARRVNSLQSHFGSESVYKCKKKKKKQRRRRSK